MNREQRRKAEKEGNESIITLRKRIHEVWVFSKKLRIPSPGIDSAYHKSLKPASWQVLKELLNYMVKEVKEQMEARKEEARKERKKKIGDASVLNSKVEDLKRIREPEPVQNFFIQAESVQKMMAEHLRSDSTEVRTEE